LALLAAACSDVLLEVPAPPAGVDGSVEAVRYEFTSISAGGSHSCGVRGDASVVCWGRNYSGQARPPQGSFTAVSAGDSHSCGVRVDASVVCWGDNEHGQTDAPAGTYIAVAACHSHSCALRNDHTATCWGAVASDLRSDNP